MSYRLKGRVIVRRGYYLPRIEIKDYNAMINGKKFFNQPVKIDLKTYDNILKTLIGQSEDYTTACLLEYNYFKKYYKIIAIDLSKQQTLDSDLKTIQQKTFPWNVANSSTIFFVIEEAQVTVLDFLHTNRKSRLILFLL